MYGILESIDKKSILTKGGKMKMLTVLSLSLLPNLLLAKEHTYRFPAQSVPSLQYTASCEILKANLKTSPKWVSVAKKDLVVKPSDGKSNPDITLNADDVQIEFTALVNEMDIGKGTLYVSAASFLTVKNTKTSDSMKLSGHDQTQYDTNRVNEMASVDTTYTLGYLDPRTPNSYMIGCKIITK
jgi:hypothetical protein